MSPKTHELYVRKHFGEGNPTFYETSLSKENFFICTSSLLKKKFNWLFLDYFYILLFLPHSSFKLKEISEHLLDNMLLIYYWLLIVEKSKCQNGNISLNPIQFCQVCVCVIFMSGYILVTTYYNLNISWQGSNRFNINVSIDESLIHDTYILVRCYLVCIIQISSLRQVLFSPVCYKSII